MTSTRTNLTSASTAIIAVLALGSTAAWAQDAAAPAIDALPVQPPAIELPTEAPAPAPPAAAAPMMTSQPVVQQAPIAAPAETAPAPEERASTTRPAERRPVVRAAAPAAPATTPVLAPVADPLPPVAAAPQAVPAVTPPPPVAASQADEPADAEVPLQAAGGAAALLLALGLGGAAALRARRRRAGEHEVEPAPAQPSGRESDFEAPLPAFATVEDVAGEPVVHVVEPRPHPSVAQRLDSEEMPAAEPFGMPDAAPRSREERDALLERMVSAPPSEENPFTSRKGRLRRARIILQSLEQQQKQETTQPFDWRTYKPSTSSPTPATPPRVTA